MQNHLPPGKPTPVLHALPNGLDVIVQEDHANPLVAVQVWVRAGSIHEGAWSGGGMAHLCEHMLFKGTATRSSSEISQAIQALGGYVNAYTSFNRTVYYIEGLAENVEGYLEILADMVQRSRFDPEELEREKDVIRREMAMDNDDANSAGQRLMQSTAFKVHPLRHPIIGHRSIFDQISHAALLDFVRKNYSPTHCFIIVTGAVSASDVFEMTAKHYGQWQRQPGEPEHLPAEPPQLSARSNTIGFPTDITRVSVGWPIPGEVHEDKPALDVLAFLLGSGRSSRLYRELRDKQSVAHNVWAGAWSAAECGMFSVDAESDPADAAKAKAGLDKVIQAMVSRGPTAAELEKAIRATVASQCRALVTTRGQAANLGHGWLVAHSLDYGTRYLESIRALTPASIKQVAARYFRPDRANTVIVEPISEAATAITTAGSVQTRLPVEKLVLPNGLTVLLGENHRLPLVSIRASFLAGVLAETDAAAGVTQVAAQLLLKGTSTRSADELASIMEERGGSLNASGDAHRLMLSSELLAGDEKLALELIHDLVSSPTLPKAALEAVKKRQLASIREEQEDPLTVALRLARRHVFAGTPFARTALGTLESIPSLGVAQCRSHLKNALTGGNGVLSVFGDFDPKAIKKHISLTLGKLPKGPRKLQNCRALPVLGKAGSWQQKLEKEQAVLVVGFRTVGLHDERSYVLSMIDEACSDMGSRLFNRIREELGLAYYVGAQTFLAYGAGAFYFYVGTDVKKLALAKKELLAQIADLAKNGLQADELERAKVTWKSSWLRAQQGNGAMADTHAWDELNGMGYEHFQRLPGIIEAITPAKIKQVASQFFSAKQAFITEVIPS